jgi:hypothetical protein
LLDAKIIDTGIDEETRSHQHRSVKEIIGALLMTDLPVVREIFLHGHHGRRYGDDQEKHQREL